MSEEIKHNKDQKVGLERIKKCCCPFCGSESVELDELNAYEGENGPTQRGFCMTCKMSWLECYELTKWEDIA